MTSTHPWPHWSQQLDVARSAPLASISVIARDQRLAIAGEFAPELAAQLGIDAKLIATSLAPERTAGAIHPEALADALDASDFLIVADAGLADWLVANPLTLFEINLKLRNGIVLPARLTQAACAMVWTTGFSWVEHTDENAWIWCEAPTHAIAHARLHNLSGEPLSAQIEYELGCIHEDHRNVTLSLDGVEFDVAPIGEWRSRSVHLEPGLHELKWSSDLRPVHPHESSRALSFCVKNFRLMKSADMPALSVWQAYEVANSSNDLLRQDIAIRRILHHADFVSITGVLRNGSGLSRHHPLQLTHGSAAHGGPFEAASGDLYAGMSTKLNDVAWYLASRRAGNNFEQWARSVCDAR
jgi:hypothetical protein